VFWQADWLFHRFLASVACNGLNNEAAQVQIEHKYIGRRRQALALIFSYSHIPKRRLKMLLCATHIFIMQVAATT